MSDGIPTVFVVDDDASVRQSLRLLIDSAGWRPETFASGSEFLAHPRSAVPSCLVLDIVLPEFDGWDLQKRIAERVEMPIIFISGHGDVPVAVRAMKAGAVDFLSKPWFDDAILSTIRSALERSRCALGDAALSRALHERYASLSRRERQVLELVASGLLNKQVGATLEISEITVKAHRGRMMRKMQARSLPDLVRMSERLHRRSTPT